MSNLKAFTIILLGTLLSSCAFTNDNVKIDYTPSNFAVSTSSSKAIQIAPLKDVRGVAPNLISYKGVQGKTGGQYLNDIEISQYLTDSLKNMFVKMGYNLNSSESPIAITGEVLKFDSYCIMGFWSGSVEAAIQINLKLINNKTKAIIWNEVVSGNGKETGIQIDHWENRKIAIDRALEVLMRNIATSDSLRSAIESN